MFKKLFVSAILCTASMVAMAQSQIITHVVQRGETLESIAKFYNISVADLNNANPNADGIIYVGMKLAVPVTTASTTTTPTTTTSATAPAANTSTTTTATTTSNLAETTSSYSEPEYQRNTPTAQEFSSKENKRGKIEPAMEIGFLYDNFIGGKAKDKFKWAPSMSLAFGARFYITNNLFAETLIGYKWVMGIYEKDYLKGVFPQRNGTTGDFSTHSIYVPTYFGVDVNKFTFKAGPYFDYIVNGKEVFENHRYNYESKEKIKNGNFSAGFNFSASISGVGLKFKIGVSSFAGGQTDGGKEMAIGLFLMI